MQEENELKSRRWRKTSPISTQMPTQLNVHKRKEKTIAVVLFPAEPTLCLNSGRDVWKTSSHPLNVCLGEVTNCQRKPEPIAPVQTKTRKTASIYRSHDSPQQNNTNKRSINNFHSSSTSWGGLSLNGPTKNAEAKSVWSMCVCACVCTEWRHIQIYGSAKKWGWASRSMTQSTSAYPWHGWWPYGLAYDSRCLKKKKATKSYKRDKNESKAHIICSLRCFIPKKQEQITFLRTKREDSRTHLVGGRCDFGANNEPFGQKVSEFTRKKKLNFQSKIPALKIVRQQKYRLQKPQGLQTASREAKLGTKGKPRCSHIFANKQRRNGWQNELQAQKSVQLVIIFQQRKADLNATNLGAKRANGFRRLLSL